MSKVLSGESAVSNALTGGVIIVTAVLLMSVLAGLFTIAPSAPVAPVAKPAVQEVVVTAVRPHRVS